MASLLNMSGGSLLNKGLPYDAEIEYLESKTPTGSYGNTDTYIQTDIIPHSSDTVEMHISNYVGTNGSHFLCCAGHYAYPGNYGLNILNSSPSWGYYFRGSIRDFQMSYPTDNSIHIVYFGNSYVGYDDTRDLVYMGVSDFTANGTLSIFGEKVSRGIPCYGIKARLHKFLLYNVNHQIKLDCIPVRIGTTGYMYDKVSKQLFANAGTGSFILGPDVTN